MKTLLILICSPLFLFGQNTIGLPDVINYSKQSYSAGLQNWDIKQDKNGIVYIANNEGLLSFDGKFWNLYPLPNKTIVRSIEIGPDNKIYVGGQDELGYFSPAKNGCLQYHSLIRFIPQKDKSFGDVWDIISFQKSVFFRSPNKIFKFTNEAAEAYTALSEWAYLGVCNGKLYAHDYKSGLMVFEREIWTPLFVNNGLPKNDPVTSVIPIRKDSALVTTLKSGLFILSKEGISKPLFFNNRLFENERIYTAIPVEDGRIALGTNNSGVYIIDLKGNIIQSFSKAEGLQNNNVLSIFPDNDGNLWLGLDNGIDLVAYNSAIKEVNPYSQDGSGYTAIIFDQKLYLGTTNGLYSVPLQPVHDLSFSKGTFLPVNNTKGQTWGLSVINNQLLLGHHEGAFVIKGNTAQSISADPGFWNFVPLSGTFPTPQIVAGNYKGLTFFNFMNQQFIRSASVPDFQESSRFVTIDQDDNIWVSHPYHGVYKIVRKKEGTYPVYAYTEKNGLPSALNNHVYKIKSEILVGTEKGVFKYNPRLDHFEPSPDYRKILGDQSIRYLKEDAEGNIWFIHEKMLGVIDLSGKEPVVIYLPELNYKMLSGFEFIYPVNKNNIFLGAERGFIHINYEKYKQTKVSQQVQIRTVRMINKTDSLLFGGYFQNVNEKQVQGADNIPEINNNWKAIRFEFSSSHLANQSNHEYSIRLKNFDENWSSWSKRTDKEYTHLPPGKYTFEVKVRNNLGNESAPAAYSFIILHPWYQTRWAILLYFLLAGLLIWLIYRWQQKKFKRQHAKFEEEQKRLLYIHELELNKTESELVALRNEKLEAEINFKNSEMASSAMHLVKKGELLSKIKSEIAHMMKVIDNPQAIGELKKMIKTLSEDDNMDKEWENFAKHFDKVHSDFVKGLKSKYPSITPNELKLCTYLRMNLSTKEIAQLMNISVRGVEISRYRLRKKLQVPTETNLFDYLINLKESI